MLVEQRGYEFGLVNAFLEAPIILCVILSKNFPKFLICKLEEIVV